MGYIRNLVTFGVFALIITGCGGGNTTIAASDTSSGATSGGSSGTTGGSTGGGSLSSTGSVTLKWTAPSTLADGTATSLSNVSGYTLFYGLSPTDTPNSINISNGSTTQYTIDLPSGSYYFVICAIDSNGNQGLMSVALNKSI